VEYPQHRMQNLQEVRSVPVMLPGQSQLYLGDIASITTPKMPGEIDRYIGQRVITLTANLHEVPLGKALPTIQHAIQDTAHHLAAGVFTCGAKRLGWGRHCVACESACCLRWWSFFSFWRPTSNRSGWRWQ
jgi:hypothetical protein